MGPPEREKRGPGMDHPHYEFSALPSRQRLVWPGGARVAFWVLLHLEHWEMIPPEDAVRDARFRSEFGSFTPDYRTYSQREYGNRVGIFRLFEVLDRHGIKVTVAAGSAALERYPYLVEECRKRGWEFAAHGSYANRLISSRMSEAEERAFIAESIAAIERATGTRPTGWLGQDAGESARTPALLAEAGLEYVMDWPNDDQPYTMSVGRPFVSIPNPAEWDDVQLLWHRRVAMGRYPQLVFEGMQTLYEEGAESGRLFGLGLHPWLLGMAHRIRYLDEAFERLAGFDKVWPATAGEIAEWYLSETRK